MTGAEIIRAALEQCLSVLQSPYDPSSRRKAIAATYGALAAMEQIEKARMEAAIAAMAIDAMEVPRS